MRSRRFVSYLAQKAQVDIFVLSPAGQGTDWDYIRATFRHSYFAHHNGSLSSFKKYALLLPWQLAHLYTKKTQVALNQLVQKENYDFIFVNKLYPVPYLLQLPPKWHERVVVDFDDILSDLYRKSYKNFITSRKNSFFLKLNEERALKAFRRVFLCAEGALSKINPRFRHKVGIIPNVFTADVKGVLEAPKSKNQLLFVGSLDYEPNVDGLEWFLAAIWPEAKKSYPDLKLTVIGKVQNKPDRVYSQFSRYQDLTIELNVPDVKPYYRDSYASVVPLLNGSGTRLKILESYAYGRPVMTTQKGVEGLDFEDKKSIFTFHDGRTFVDSYQTLLDRENYQKVSESGFKVLERKYSPSAFEKEMDENWNLITGN